MSTLSLGNRTFDDGDMVIMAVINRTPDSFYDRGATYALDAALDAVDRAVDEGADVLDVGGVKAGHGPPVEPAEELRRTADLVAAARDRYPDLVISVDTWRSEVARVLVDVGADLLNDTWSGADPLLAEVAARASVGIVCSHTGGLTPRTDPHRSQYRDVMADVVSRVRALAEHAVSLGVPPERILVDPTHDFGKNTYQSLEVTRRLSELVGTGWPVLVAVSNKDFVGESLNLPTDQRTEGTLAALAVCCWLGARVFRVHDVRAARRTVDMVATIAGHRRPSVARRGLA